MLAELVAVYRRIPIVIAMAPLLFLLPVLGEGAQHVAEVRLGMFTSGDGLAPGQETTIRLMFGTAKVLTVFASVVLTALFLARRNNTENHGLRSWTAALNRYDVFSVVLLIGAIVGPMVVHYGLNTLAVDQPTGVMTAILVLDSLVVGCLALVLGSTAFTLLLRVRT